MGLTDVINMDAIQQDHPKLFTKLFKAILNYRLNELDFSRVSSRNALFITAKLSLFFRCYVG